MLIWRTDWAADDVTRLWKADSPVFGQNAYVIYDLVELDRHGEMAIPVTHSFRVYLNEKSIGRLCYDRADDAKAFCQRYDDREIARRAGNERSTK